MKKFLPVTIAILALLTGCNPEAGTKEGPSNSSETDKEKSNIVGTYENDIGTLELKNSGEFNILVGTQSCTGEVSGTAKLNGDKAEYNGKNCKLSFKIKQGDIEITEKNCHELHGASCSFDGLYKKKVSSSTTSTISVHTEPLTVGTMVGEEYANGCSYSTPADNKGFNYNDLSTWRFLFSSTMDRKEAKMIIDGKLRNLSFVKVANDKDTTIESYLDNNIEVEIRKTVVPITDGSIETTKYKGKVLIRKGKSDKVIPFLGECGA